MATPLTGTVVRTAQPDATGTVGQVVGDSTDTNCYVSNRKAAGGVYQVVIGTGAVSGGSWPVTGLTNPSGVALTADDATLYVLVDNGDLYSIPVSAPAATKIGPTFNNVDSFTTSWSGLLLDPVYTRRIMAWNRTAKKIYVLDLDSFQATYYAVPGGTHFLGGVGRYRADNDIFLVTVQTSGPTGAGLGGDTVLKWFRKQHRWEVLAGTGGNSNSASGAAANLTTLAPSSTNNTRTFASDSDGRVYLGRGTNTFTKVENGILTDLNTSLASSVVGGTWYLPSLNQCLAGLGGGRVVVLS